MILVRHLKSFISTMLKIGSNKSISISIGPLNILIKDFFHMLIYLSRISSTFKNAVQEEEFINFHHTFK